MFRSVVHLVVAVGLVAGATIHAGAAERPMVEVMCSPTAKKLVYMCMFKVMGKKSHQPITDAEFTLKADMPSMPMAHSVPPMQPEPTEKPGVYHAMIELEMMGEWALKMEFAKPVRDIVIEKITFGKQDAKMDHSGHGSGEEHKTSE